MSLMTAAEVQAAIERNVASALGFEFEVTAVTGDGAEVRVPFRENMVRLGDTVSGPVLMTLVDIALYAAVVGHVPDGEYGVTSHLNIEFLNRPPRAALAARCRILRRGRRQMTCTVSIESESDGRLVAHATGAYALFGPPPG
ncbi:hypothetical protein PC39_03527 [Salinisphaera sp. PC39]|uniref:PaaI family thioesterase n=1 Tax=Salinisphaera sp. PC39 TaxID=1304156 RepID=UPI003340EE52